MKIHYVLVEGCRQPIKWVLLCMTENVIAAKPSTWRMQQEYFSILLQFQNGRFLSVSEFIQQIIDLHGEQAYVDFISVYVETAITSHFTLTPTSHLYMCVDPSGEDLQQSSIITLPPDPHTWKEMGACGPFKAEFTSPPSRECDANWVPHDFFQFLEEQFPKSRYKYYPAERDILDQERCEKLQRYLESDIFLQKV